LKEYNKHTKNRAELIDRTILQTRNCENWIGYSPEQYDRLEACSRSKQFRDAAHSMIGELNEELASALCKINATNLDERANQFTRRKNGTLQPKLRDNFVRSWCDFDCTGQVPLTVNELRRWGVRLFKYLVVNWTEAIWSHGCPELVTELEEGEADFLLKGSHPTLYVIAG